MITIDYTDIKCEQFGAFARTWLKKEKEIQPILVENIVLIMKINTPQLQVPYLIKCREFFI